MRGLLFVILMLVIAPASGGAQDIQTSPNQGWEMADFSTFSRPGSDRMACATDSLGSIVCVELMWDLEGYLTTYLSIFYHNDLNATHASDKLPVLIFQNGKISNLNNWLKWERFLGTSRNIPQYISGNRVTWRAQVAAFESYTNSYTEDVTSFYRNVQNNNFLDILSYLDDGREIVSELTLEGLPSLLDELVEEARLSAPSNALWVRSAEMREDSREVEERFDNKYRLTEEDLSDAAQKRLERERQLREKVQRLKQQQQDSGGN